MMMRWEEEEAGDDGDNKYYQKHHLQRKTWWGGKPLLIFSFSSPLELFLPLIICNATVCRTDTNQKFYHMMRSGKTWSHTYKRRLISDTTAVSYFKMRRRGRMMGRGKENIEILKLNIFGWKEEKVTSDQKSFRIFKKREENQYTILSHMGIKSEHQRERDLHLYWFSFFSLSQKYWMTPLGFENFKSVTKRITDRKDHCNKIIRMTDGRTDGRSVNQSMRIKSQIVMRSHELEKRRQDMTW